MARWNEVLVVDQMNVFGWNGTNYRRATLDESTRALVSVSYEHHEIHEGDHYYVSSVQDLANSNVLDVQFTTPDTTKWSHFVWSFETESETAWYIYEGATISQAGTSLTAINNNRNSANTSGNTIAYHLNANLAAANADTSVVGATLLSSGISGSGKNSLGGDKRENEVILKQNTVYCLRAVANAAGYIDFLMEWYEHTSESA